MEQGDKRKECCRDEKNLGPVVQERKDLTYRRCQVCQCRHFELTVEPGRLGLRGGQVGG
jgi:hypothetical protein